MRPRKAFGADVASAPHRLAVERDDTCGRFDQAGDAAAERRLARARLAHQRQRLAAADRELDAVHRLHRLARATDREALDQILDLEKGAHVTLSSTGKWHRTERPPAKGRGDGASTRQRSRRRTQRDGEGTAAGRHRRGIRVGTARPAQAELGAVGEGGEQRDAVGMRRPLEEGRDRRELDDLPGIDHGDARTVMRGDGDIAGDEQCRGALLRHHGFQQVQHLGLHRDVEPAGGVVGDHQLGRTGQRNGDHDALGHPPAQLVRVGGEAPFGIGNADRAQHLDGAPVGFGPADAHVVEDDVRDLASHRQDRVELGARIGDDHGELAAQNGAVGLVVEARQVAAVEQHLAPLDDSRRRHQSHRGARQRGLSRPRFADQADELAGRDGEVDALQRAHRLGPIGRKAHPEIGDVEDRCAGGHGLYALRRGSSAK